MGHTDRTAQPETSSQSRYVIRAGELAHDSYELDLTPARAGWEWSSLRVVALAPGKPLPVPAGEHEYLVLPLSGGCTVQAGGERGAIEAVLGVGEVVVVENHDVGPPGADHLGNLSQIAVDIELDAVGAFQACLGSLAGQVVAADRHPVRAQRGR